MAYGCSDFVERLEKLKLFSIKELVERKVTYHSDCYKLVTNKTTLNRLKDRSETFKSPTSSCENNSPKSSIAETPGSSKVLRSSMNTFEKSLCVICQQRGGKLHKVMSTTVGLRMFEVSKVLTDQSFFIRMNNVPNACDAVANDAEYHLSCWVTAQREAKRLVGMMEVQEIQDPDRILADIEIIDTVNYILETSKNTVLNMNDINTTYNNLMGNSDTNHVNYKRYLKQLLTENISNIVFSRPPLRTEAERVCSAETQGKAIHHVKNCADDISAVFECAKIIRNKLLQQNQWKFKGSYGGFTVPKLLQTLLKWIIIGPKQSIDTCSKMAASLDNSVSNICQIVLSSTKTRRQVEHKPKINSAEATFRNIHETPFTVGLGLHVYKETRSKKLIDCLSCLNLSVSYDKIVKIETELANAVADVMQKNSGVYLYSTAFCN